jgi:hypothetical protein
MQFLWKVEFSLLSCVQVLNISLVAVLKLKSKRGQCILGLQLVISESSTKVFSSPVYEVKKGSPSFHIRLDQYVSLQGDIKVEFFNKPKMMRRVSSLMLSLS